LNITGGPGHVDNLSMFGNPAVTVGMRFATNWGFNVGDNVWMDGMLTPIVINDYAGQTGPTAPGYSLYGQIGAIELGSGNINGIVSTFSGCNYGPGDNTATLTVMGAIMPSLQNLGNLRINLSGCDIVGSITLAPGTGDQCVLTMAGCTHAGTNRFTTPGR
jgi:hypothetical protein